MTRINTDNLKSLERVTKLASLIPDLHKVGLILASGMIHTPDDDIEDLDNIDFEDIIATPLS